MSNTGENAAALPVEGAAADGDDRREERFPINHPNLMSWLQTVDRHVQRSEEWLMPVYKCLVEQGYHFPEDLVGVSKENRLAHIQGPLGTFLVRAIARANTQQMVEDEPPPGQPERSQQVFNVGDPLAALHQAIEAAKPEKTPKHSIKISPALQSMNLKWLPSSVWPSQDLVDKLADETAKETAKRPDQYPFTYVDLSKDALPNWVVASNGNEEEEEAELLANAAVETLGSIATALQKAAKPSKKPLTFPQWVGSFQRYSVAAAAAKQWNYASSQAHLDICLRVADSARAGGTKRWL